MLTTRTCHGAHQNYNMSCKKPHHQCCALWQSTGSNADTRLVGANAAQAGTAHKTWPTTPPQLGQERRYTYCTPTNNLAGNPRAGQHTRCLRTQGSVLSTPCCRLGHRRQFRKEPAAQLQQPIIQAPAPAATPTLPHSMRSPRFLQRRGSQPKGHLLQKP